MTPAERQALESVGFQVFDTADEFLDAIQYDRDSLADFKAYLGEVVKAEAIDPWLSRSNPAFEGKTPLEVWRSGDRDRLWRMAYELGSGSAT